MTDVFQFQALGQTQREAILRKLNGDIQSLLKEYNPQDHEYSQLQDEMRRCNLIFQELTARCAEEGEFSGVDFFISS